MYSSKKKREPRAGFEPANSMRIELKSTAFDQTLLPRLFMKMYEHGIVIRTSHDPMDFFNLC